MCYKSVAAFEADDGTLFKTETGAILHSVQKITGLGITEAEALLAKSAELMPHLQRIVALASAETAKHLPPAKAKKDPRPIEEAEEVIPAVRAMPDSFEYDKRRDDI